jgi:hypothetical protein
LPKGILLYNSLLNVINQPFKLYILCLDESTHDFFIKYKNDFKNVYLIKILDFEVENQDLEFAKLNRSKVEYYFTLSPVLPLYILKKFKLDHICSMDADLFFYNTPESIFDSLKHYSIIITPHNFSKELDDRKKYGLFNVSFQIFKSDEIGFYCLNKWKNQCIDWCKDDYDEKNSRFADQKYLDSWEKDYKKHLLILNRSDMGLAIWNINNYKLDFKSNLPISDGRNVIFYHFHNFKSITNNIIFNGFYNYKVKRNDNIDKIYKNYWQLLTNIIVKYELNIDKSIRTKEINILSKLINECTFYYFGFEKIFHFNLKYLHKIIRKIMIKIYG